MQIMIALLKISFKSKFLLIEYCYVPFAELTEELEGRRPDK